MATKPNSVLGDYLKEIKRYALLTAEEERELGMKIRAKFDAEERFATGEIDAREYDQIQRNAAEARDQMVQANLRLVISVAKHFRNRGLPLEDLVNEGNVGLMNAVDRFDPTVGSRFSTYAGYWIDQAIRRAVQNAQQIIHIPSYLMEQIGHMRIAMRELEEQLDRPPGLDEICDYMGRRLATRELTDRLERAPTEEEVEERLNEDDFKGFTQRKAKAILQAIKACSSRMQGSATVDGENTLSESLEDTRTPAPFEAVFSESDAEFVSNLLDRITDREARILKLRYGLNERKGKRMTLKEIGEEVGLTRERVRQIEREAKNKLEEYLKAFH